MNLLKVLVTLLAISLILSKEDGFLGENVNHENKNLRYLQFGGNNTANYSRGLLNRTNSTGRSLLTSYGNKNASENKSRGLLERALNGTVNRTSNGSLSN
jgi:hypothetical protein